ncbi:CFI-box-CTERM domain-containing protein [Prosthecobacter sp.]|uniref:CFI-box-CTERM domain-containing protein n=1 Tax=Prosthecobacter sp. TaxID=1965333 RepID=UPI003783122C
MAKSILEASLDFIRSVEERFQKVEFTDRNGQRITGLRPSELLAFHSLTAQMTQQREKPAYEIAIELEEDARKYVFIFFVLVPLFRAVTSSSMVYVAPDGPAGASLAYGRFFVTDPVEFVDLRDLTQAADYGRLQGLLKGRVVLVDMESSFVMPAKDDPTRSYSYCEAEMAKMMRTYHAILWKSGCHKVLVYQKGVKSLVSYPPTFGKASCFIATAACSTPDAWEVRALRAFRDEVLHRSAWGRLFSRCYHRLSPPLAQWVTGTQSRQRLVRRFFVNPLARLVRGLRF